MRRALPCLAVALAALFSFAAGLSAQESPPTPPSLDKGADVNDWEAWFDYGVSVIRRSPSKADAAFYWASRRDPTRAEPIYARWVTFWLNDISEFEDYLEGSPRVLHDPQVIASDSVRWRAYRRNPFVNQALAMVLVESLHGAWGSSPYSRGWIQYANQYYPKALESFHAAIEGGHLPLSSRYSIALVFSQLGHYDSAAMQMQQILDLLRKQDAQQPVYLYESKEIFEYGLGLLYAAQGQLDDAKEAEARALRENLGFAPAHVALARVAQAQGDLPTAITEFGLAAEIEPKDGAMQFWYGDAMLRAARPADAIAPLKSAVTLEPHFAAPYFALGRSYDAVHDTANAISAYSDYLKRAPRTAAQNIALATDRLTQLGSKAP